MVGSVVTLPLRIGMQAARLATRPAVALLRHLLDGDAEPAPPAPPEPPPVRPRRPVRWDDQQSRSAPATAPAAPPPPHEDPILAEDHITEEVEVVAESADPDATESPGAEVTVDEPWPGYRRAKAAEVIATLPDISGEELVVAQLYESTHRRRKTVLKAMERQLKVGSAPN